MAFRPYLSIAHHVPGRIRLRFDVSVLARFGAGRLSTFADEARAAGGLHSFRVNAAARSLAIEYDPAVVAPDVWTRFVTGDDAEAATLATRLAAHITGATEPGRDAARL